MNNTYWKNTVAALIAGIWVYTLADILGEIFDVIDSISSAGQGISALMSGEGGGGFGFVGFLSLLCSILVIVGYYFFFRSLLRFIKMQRNEEDLASANMIKQSYIYLIIAIAVGWIPVVGWIAALVLMILSYVKQLKAFKGLSESKVLPQEAKDGAAKIRKATIWMLVGSVIGIIPLIGGIAELAITIVMFFSIIAGWKLIYLGAPMISEAEAQAFAEEDAKPKSQLDIWWDALAAKIMAR